MNIQENILRIKEVMGLLNEQQTTTTGYVLPQGHVEPTCTDAGCKGEYRGPQFLKSDGSDVAHKYSNTISNYVGIKLKELYNRGIYVKVDLKSIVMTADPVQYGENYNQTHVTIDIPFIKVKNKCDAYTSFDHVGGWGHLDKNNVSKRKSTLSSLLLPGETLDVSDLKITHEKVNKSLNEYWIQWKNKTTQSDCVNNSPTPKPNVNPTPKPNVNPTPKPNVTSPGVPPVAKRYPTIEKSFKPTNGDPWEYAYDGKNLYVRNPKGSNKVFNLKDPDFLNTYRGITKFKDKTQVANAISSIKNAYGSELGLS